MKLGRYLDGDVPTLGFSLEGLAVSPVSAAFAAAELDDPPDTLLELISGGQPALDRVRDAVEHVRDDPASAASVETSEVRWLPPVSTPTKVLCVAMNNRRLNEGAHVDPEGPMFFLKSPSSLIGHREPVQIEQTYGFTFPELELAAIVGRRTRNISERDAVSHLFGYTIINDVTSQGLKARDSIAVDWPPEARDQPGYDAYFNWRNRTSPDEATLYLTYHARSKGCDTFGPLGPWVTPADEIADPNNLRIRGFADGELFTEDSTASYSYSVEHVVAFASRYMTLEAGDVIAFGTAAKGVEPYRRAHHDIDLFRGTPSVEVEVEGLGRLMSPTVHAWDR